MMSVYSIVVPRWLILFKRRKDSPKVKAPRLMMSDKLASDRSRRPSIPKDHCSRDDPDHSPVDFPRGDALAFCRFASTWREAAKLALQWTAGDRTYAVPYGTEAGTFRGHGVLRCVPRQNDDLGRATV